METTDGTRSKKVQLGLFIFGVFAVWACMKPVSFSDSMFLQLWPSILWAIGMGLASTFRCWKGVLLTLLLAIFPILAGGLYFGMSHASDESFLLAGVIPWSDAAMHFRQAAQMAVDGMTVTGMNGRFLYPAYLSSLLNIVSFNLLAAQLLSGFFFAGALVITLRTVARFIGAPGAIIVALVSWLFFRAHCSGLVMTENLGMICGLLALAAFLQATMRRSLSLFLLGIFMLSLGFCARPGALVVLPLMVLFAGWAGYHWGQGSIVDKKSVRNIFINNQTLTPMVLAVVMIAAAIGSNTLISEKLYQGRVITNGNFSFTLYGMLTGGKWSDNLAWSHWDSKLVMQESLKLIQEKPQLLVFGAARAYKEALYRRILFMFGHESRPATLLLIAAALGLVALWKMTLLRPYALWMSLIALGIFLSIPFVPPWDAAERPFAATIPFQGLLAGIGVYALLVFLKLIKSKEQEAGSSLSSVPLGILAGIVFFLTVPLPLLHHAFLGGTSSTPFHQGIALRAGSFITIPANRTDFDRRLAPFLAHYPNEVVFLTSLPQHVKIGINWGSKNFDRCAVLDNVSEASSTKGWTVDQRLIQP